MSNGNGNSDRLIGEINERTKNIASDIADIKSGQADHHTRITVLEMDKAQASGGKKALAGLLAAAATAGGFIAACLQYLLNR